jgi:hypothetical protein
MNLQTTAMWQMFRINMFFRFFFLHELSFSSKIFKVIKSSVSGEDLFITKVENINSKKPTSFVNVQTNKFLDLFRLC